MSDTAQQASEAAEQAEGFHFLLWDGSSIWLLIASALMFMFMYKKVWPLIAGMLDKRADGIRDELDEARRLREEAQKALVDAKRKQRDAESEAENIILHAREMADSLRTQAEESLEKDLARRERSALEKIEQAKSKAMSDIRDTAIDAAFEATQALFEKQLKEADQTRLIDDSISEVSGKLH
ncbi:MAG: F0F1 ATP synthase subunit B [Alphaproteobacteria bacterium]